MSSELTFPNVPEANAPRSPAFVDLFSGCGGLSMGFSEAGMRPIYAVDSSKASSESYASNFGCPVYNGLIEDFVSNIRDGTLRIPQPDLVIGGPPCQGFSPLSKMSASALRRSNHYSLNRLWNYFAEAVTLLSPSMFVTENVPQFLSSVEFDSFIARMQGYGYTVTYGVLSADHYGVPQRRRRAFAIGSRIGNPSLPVPNGRKMTVRDAIGHLPLSPSGQNWHVSRNVTALSLERYRLIPPGGNRFDLMRLRPDITPRCWLEKPTGTTDVFGRLHWDQPSSTIRTEFFKPEKGRYLHPSEDRPITHREAACLQTFPESFIFEGSKSEVARQIGEAVPPVLAFEVAKACIPLISDTIRLNP